MTDPNKKSVGAPTASFNFGQAPSLPKNITPLPLSPSEINTFRESGLSTAGFPKELPPGEEWGGRGLGPGKDAKGFDTWQWGQTTTGADAKEPYDSPLNAVANFSGSGEPDGHAHGSSVSAPLLGSHPDLSHVIPEQLAQWNDSLSHLIYSVPAGGYIYAGRNYSGLMTPGSGWHGDSNANREAANIYGAIGDLPTVANETPALTRLRGSTPGLAAPTQGPSLNTTLGEFANGPLGDAMHDAGFSDKYEGPFSIGRKRPGQRY